MEQSGVRWGGVGLDARMVSGWWESEQCCRVPPFGSTCQDYMAGLARQSRVGVTHPSTPRPRPQESRITCTAFSARCSSWSPPSRASPGGSAASRLWVALRLLSCSKSPTLLGRRVSMLWETSRRRRDTIAPMAVGSWCVMFGFGFGLGLGLCLCVGGVGVLMGGRAGLIVVQGSHV